MFAAVSIFVSLITTLIYQSGFSLSCFSNGYIAGKMTASAVFLVVGIVAFFVTKKKKYALPVLTGLFLGFAGDLLLAMSIGGNQTLFLVGMGAFFANHISFLATLYLTDRFRIRDAVVGGAVLAFLAAMLVFGKADVGGMAVPVCLYMISLSALVGKAISVFSLRKLGPTCSVLMILGILLFAVSDILLCMSMFMNVSAAVTAIIPGAVYRFSPDKALDIFNAVFYFTGQTLIACSIRYR